MIKTNKFIVFLSIFLFSLSFSSSAKEYVPNSLESWVPWVLEGNEALSCPFINKTRFDSVENHICAWPSVLELDVSNTQATFKQSWQVLTDSFVPLPGNIKQWPIQVKVNNKPIAVINQQGRPVIELSEGQYNIEGEFVFDEIPENIAIPTQYSYVKLQLNDQSVDFPKIVNQNLWLQKNETSTGLQDSIDLTVSRRVLDGKYIRLDTIIQINVSGKMREESLGSVLPDGFELIGIQSEIPAFLDGKGILQAKLKPGRWTIRVTAYAKPTLLTWKRPTVSEHWPSDEIWVFQSNENLRLGKVTGADIIDSSQADLPSNWYELPSYLVTENDTLMYNIHHRGKPLNLENQLSLNRTLWLSFDNEKFTFNDDISGQMLSDWRLSMTTPFLLESAEDIDGSVLITSNEADERGIENRYPKVEVNARGIINADNELPVTGWDNDFERVSLVLNLPPGNKLFAVFGADYVSQSWLGNWTIWASFIVLFAALVVSRVVNITAGISTALMLLFIYQQTGAPVLVVINLIVAVALLKHYPFDVFKAVIKAYWTFSIAIAVGAILFFTVTEIRTVIYPQLEQRETTYISQVEALNFVEQDAAKKKMALQRLKATQARQSKSMLSDSIALSESPNDPFESVESIVVTGSRYNNEAKKVDRYQSDALIQAGSGIPDWNWNKYQIKWNSPVANEQSFNVIVLSKNMNRAVKLIGIALSLLWLFFILKDTIKMSLKTFKDKTRLLADKAANTSKTVASIIALMLLLPGAMPDASAQEYPSQSLLEDLQQRVTQAPDCAPNCATINQLDVQANNDALTVSFVVHANVDTAVALPKSEFWRPEKITLQNQPLHSMYQHNGWIYIPVSKGISMLKIQGRIAPVEMFQLEFKELPKHVNIHKNSEWDVLGTQGRKLVGNALEFVAQVTSENSNEESSRYRSKSFVQVTRKLSIDQTWTLETTVWRIAPSSGAVNIDIPTLSGEHVTSPNVLVENETVQVTIPSGEHQYSWSSTLDRKEVFSLQASADLPFIEHWQVVVSPTWHAELSGVPIMMNEQSEEDYFAYSFYPYAGETLDLNITRPNVVNGATLAIDNVSYDMEEGTRTSTLTLDFTYRSTRGGEHIIELPADYMLKEIRTDGKLINQQINQGKLALPVLQGEHNVTISMRANIENTLIMDSPTVNLNAPVSNITTKVRLNDQRWILSASGPVLGPAVLYWGELLAFILIALLVARVKFSPLNTVSWIVLGFGLSLNNWSTLMIVAVWFASLTASSYRPKVMDREWFNFSQLYLFLLSILAIGSLISVVPTSLLSSPNMGIVGNESYGNYLQWFADQSQGILPQVSVISIPTLFYKGLMLAWVIWLCFAFLGWIKWAWGKLGEQGYWRDKPIIETIKEAKGIANNTP